MGTIDRRDLLKIGAVSALGLSLGGLKQVHEVGATASRSGGKQWTFEIEPHVVNRVSESAEARSSSPLIFSSKERSSAALLAEPFVPEMQHVASLADDEDRAPREREGAGDGQLTHVQAAMAAKLAGTGDVLDIVGEIAPLVVRQKKNIDFRLDFLHQPLSTETLLQSSVVSPSIQNEEGLIFIEEDEQVASSLFLPIEYAGWRLQFRGPETHSLGGCVRSPVAHFHVEVFRRNSGGRYDYILNVHLGTYVSGGRRCFVLWENEWFGRCWTLCSPTRDDLVRMFSWILLAAAAVAGVVIAAWIVAAIAATASSVLYVPLLLLA